MPYPFLRRLLRTLKRGGWVEAVAGSGGGVRLARDPRRMRLSDLVRLFQGGVRFSECRFRDRACENRRGCPLRKRLRKMEERISREFEKVTIGALAGKKRRA